MYGHINRIILNEQSWDLTHQEAGKSWKVDLIQHTDEVDEWKVHVCEGKQTADRRENWYKLNFIIHFCAVKNITVLSLSIVIQLLHLVLSGYWCYSSSMNLFASTF